MCNVSVCECICIFVDVCVCVCLHVSACTDVCMLHVFVCESVSVVYICVSAYECDVCVCERVNVHESMRERERDLCVLDWSSVGMAQIAQ